MLTGEQENDLKGGQATSGTTYSGEIRKGRGDPRQLMVGKQATQMRDMVHAAPKMCVPHPVM